MIKLRTLKNLYDNLEDCIHEITQEEYELKILDEAVKK